ncbi:MAG: RsmE family RNA methyltransferase [Proteobacteria bacterium]|jgi:16S rRNA (uracil1498-N3)-methyltransferase|nr:RsmE family RNA methyltransferase [Pseudomonadota bacterium]
MKIRVFTPQKIADIITLDAEQTHYLTKVMRQKLGDEVIIFNQEYGEFVSKFIEINRSFCRCKVIEKLRNFTPQIINLKCIFSIIKQKNVEFIIQKCTELGVSEFIPMQTARTTNEHLNIERLNKIAIEATEQCGRIDVPKVHQPIKIANIETHLSGFETFLLHQNGTGKFPQIQNNRCIIIGCEGGFTDGELAHLETFSRKIMVSQHILRAETAAILGCGMLMLQ